MISCRVALRPFAMYNIPDSPIVRKLKLHSSPLLYDRLEHGPKVTRVGSTHDAWNRDPR